MPHSASPAMLAGDGVVLAHPQLEARVALAALAVVGRREARVLDGERHGSPSSGCSSSVAATCSSAWSGRAAGRMATATARGPRPATPTACARRAMRSQSGAPHEWPRWPSARTSRRRAPTVAVPVDAARAARSRPSRRRAPPGGRRGARRSRRRRRATGRGSRRRRRTAAASVRSGSTTEVSSPAAETSSQDAGWPSTATAPSATTGPARRRGTGSPGRWPCRRPGRGARRRRGRRARRRRRPSRHR